MRNVWIIAMLLLLMQPSLSFGGAATLRADDAKIKAEQQRLQRLNSSITRDKRKLANMTAEERKRNRALSLWQKQSSELESYLVLLGRETSRIQDSIIITEMIITDLERRITMLRKEYADLVEAVHKAGTATDEELLVTDESYSDQDRMTHYLNDVTSLASRKAKDLVVLRDSLDCEKENLLQLLSHNERNLLEEQQRKEQLQSSISQQEKAIKSIKGDKRQLQSEIDKKQASAKKLQGIVRLLIAEEAKRSRGGGVTGAPVAGTTSSAFKQNSLAWPVNSKKLLHTYGKQRNRNTGTETENLGIDIQVAKGSSVRAVAAGRVSLIHFLPGYGSFVIVDHGNSFRTIYANLGSIQVTKGERLNAGSVIGLSGQSVEGEYLHFEVWKGRDHTNPKSWLK